MYTDVYRFIYTGTNHVFLGSMFQPLHCLVQDGLRPRVGGSSARSFETVEELLAASKEAVGLEKSSVVCQK